MPTSNSKKKKKAKKSKEEGAMAAARLDFCEKLRAEAWRLHTQVPACEKPYLPKATDNGTIVEGKITKFKQVPKNQCLYCAR